jgi:hypothetical protein
MIEFAPFLVPISLFVSLAAVAILRGPLGRALGERWAGRRLDSDASAETAALHEEVEELRFRLTEVEERLDFTERLLAQHGGPGALPKDQL